MLLTLEIKTSFLLPNSLFSSTRFTSINDLYVAGFIFDILTLLLPILIFAFGTFFLCF